MAQLQLNDFSGSINQASAPDLLKTNQSPLMVNVALDQAGNVGGRLGSSLLFTSATNTRDRGSMTYEKADGTHTLMTFHGGNLYKWNGTTETLVSASLYGSNSELFYVNYLNRIYFATGESGEYLKYYDGSSVSTVNGNLEVKYLTVSNNRLVALGGNSHPRRINYSDSGDDTMVVYGTASSSSTGTSLVSSANLFTAAHVGKKVYNLADHTDASILAYVSATTVTLDTTIDETWDGDTFRVGDNWADLDMPGTAIKSLGESAPIIAHDGESMYVFDTETNALRKKFGFGCSAHRTLQINQGNAFWLGRQGIFRYSEGESYPVKISRIVDNSFTGEALFNKISGTGFSIAAAGVTDDKYCLAVGNLSGTIGGETLEDVILVYDFRQGTWKVDTYPAIGAGTSFTTWIDGNGNEQLVVGSRDSGKMYKIDVDGVYADDGTPVESFYRTKHLEFSYSNVKGSLGPEIEKQIRGGHLKVFSDTGGLEINYAKDGATTYTNWTNTTDTPAGYLWHRHQLTGFREPEFKSLSIEVRGTGNWILYYLGLDIKPLGSTNIKEI